MLVLCCIMHVSNVVKIAAFSRTPKPFKIWHNKPPPCRAPRRPQFDEVVLSLELLRAAEGAPMHRLKEVRARRWRS